MNGFHAIPTKDIQMRERIIEIEAEGQVWQLELPPASEMRSEVVLPWEQPPAKLVMTGAGPRYYVLHVPSGEWVRRPRPKQGPIPKIVRRWCPWHS